MTASANPGGGKSGGPLATILLVDDEPTTLTLVRNVLARDPSLRIELAADGVIALAMARANPPDVIISDYEMPRMNGFELCQAVKKDPALSGALFVVLTGNTDQQLKVRGLDIGVDEYLTKPVESAELIARTRAMLRLKRLHDELRSDKLELEHLHGAEERSFESLVALLIHIVDLRIPGSADRGRRLANLAVRVATKFEIPVELLPDLDRAAKLQEIGRAVDPLGAMSPVTDGEDWPHTVISQQLLEGIERLRGAAEVIGDLFEHWDGSGFPRHIQSGQIPLRSRILRVCMDYLNLADAEQDGEAGHLSIRKVIATLNERRNTIYDPLVVLHLESVVLDATGPGWATTRRHVDVSALREGMVLAADLCTSSGVKLLGEGATLSRGTIEIILRRHAGDPIVQGAWVRRS